MKKQQRRGRRWVTQARDGQELAGGQRVRTQRLHHVCDQVEVNGQQSASEGPRSQGKELTEVVLQHELNLVGRATAQRNTAQRQTQR